MRKRRKPSKLAEGISGLVAKDIAESRRGALPGKVEEDGSFTTRDGRRQYDPEERRLRRRRPSANFGSSSRDSHA